MHVEKNVFDNIFNTVMDIKGKTKDNVKARMDLKEYCRRRELELQEQNNGTVYKPKAKFTFNIDKKRAVCEWVKQLRMPDDYASKLDRSVDVRDGRIFGMKSHDCHVFMERLLPMAFRALPDGIWKPLTELSQFFRDICSTILRKEDLQTMHSSIPIIICKLERIFPPGFFDVMEHLPIHLPYEALVGGPVQYRWMYPYERFLNKLKQKVKNKARPEGSICEAYLIEEVAHFCQYYFEPHVQSNYTRVRRNDDGGVNENATTTLSIFNLPGRPSGACSSRFMEPIELDVAHLYVLLNCDEVEPYKK